MPETVFFVTFAAPTVGLLLSLVSDITKPFSVDAGQTPTVAMFPFNDAELVVIAVTALVVTA